MQCLNIKNKEVAALLKEYTEIFGNEDAAYYVLSENNGYGLDKAPNGADSKLFSDLLAHYNGDKNKAILAKSKVYTDSFKNWFGDWLSDNKSNVSKVVDENGEPLVVYHTVNPNYDASFEVFDTNIEGKETMIYHTDDREMSFTYAKNHRKFKTIESVRDRLSEIPENIKRAERRIRETENATEEYVKELGYESLSDPDWIRMVEYNRNSMNNNIRDLKTEQKELEDILNNPRKIEYVKVDFVSLKNPLIINGKSQNWDELSDNPDVDILVKIAYNDSYNKAKMGIRRRLEQEIISNSQEQEQFYILPFDEVVSEEEINNLENRVEAELEKEFPHGPFELESTRTIEDKYRNSEYDGIIYNDIKDYGSGTSVFQQMTPHNVFVAKNSNQVKSVDNQGTFFTQDNNIYNQQAQSQTGTGRNEELARLLQTLYPKIEVGTLTDSNLRGQAHVEGNMAGKVLLNAVLENQDTLPHEYAHHYIAWFRNAPIVQNGIKQFGSEESLVQAIGENSVKATKWYNRFFNWIKGLFNKKQATLNAITNSFLSGKELSKPNTVSETEIHNQEVLDKTYSKLIKVTEARLRVIVHSANKDGIQTEKLQNLFNRLNQLENDKAVIEFITYMNDDVNSAFDLLTMYEAQFNDFKNGTNSENTVTADKLDLIRKGTIGFYDSIITNLKNMLEDPEVMDMYKSIGLYDSMLARINASLSKYNELRRHYDNLSNAVAKYNLIEEAKKYGSFSIPELMQKLDEGDTDLGFWDRYIGQTQYSNSETIRLILNKISEAKYKVYDQKLSKGKGLLKLLEKVNKSDLQLFFERDKNGKRTGNFTRDLNFGQHEQDYREHMLKLIDSFGIKIPNNINFSDIPSILDPEQLKKWNEVKNEWDDKNSERKFTKDFYALINNLSADALAMKNNLDLDINNILNPTRDKDGFVHKEKLSEEQLDKYNRLVAAKRNLANPFNMDGTPKTGKDLEIAKEFQEYNKKLRKNSKYTVNKIAFDKAREKAKKTLSAEEFKLWEKRNTVDKISEKFYEDLKKLSSVKVKSEKQEQLEYYRQQLIRLYTVDNKTKAMEMPDRVKFTINTLDKMIAEEAKRNAKSGQKSRIMEIAEWEINPEFYEQLKYMYNNSSPNDFKAWVNKNGYFGKDGQVVPASFWKRLVPKKELASKYIEKVPDSSWIEMDKTSPFYNKNFNASYGMTRVPKRSKYDNTANFNKIKGNAKVLYDALVRTMEESNRKIFFKKHLNNGQLPQIEGGAWTLMMSQDNVLKGLGYTFKDVFTTKEDDPNAITDATLDPDGTGIRLVPTRFMKRLDNPEALTNDIVGSIIAYYGMAVNFEEMSKIAPEMEMYLSMIGRQEFKNKKGESITGKNSNTYKKAEEMIKQFVYGVSDNDDTLKLTTNNKKIEIDINKALTNLANFTRLNGLANNLNAILTGMFGNKIQSRLDAISGIYYNNDALRKANKEIISSYRHALANIGNPNNKNKALCVLEWSGTVRSADQMFSKLNQSRWLRALNQHFWYGGFEMADYITKGKVSLAIMMNYKFDPETKSFVNQLNYFSRFSDKREAEAKWNTLNTTLYDAFEVVDNQFKIKDEFKNIVDDVLSTRVRNTIKQVCTRIDTQFTDLDKSFISSNTYCKLLLIYRNFLFVNLQTKFLTKRGYDYSTGLWQEAQYRGAFNYLYRHYINKDKIKTLQEMYQNYDSLDEFERRLLKRVIYEVVFCTFGLYFISLLTKAIADDDEDAEWKQLLALVSTKTAIEGRSNLIPLEVFNMFTSPTAAWGIFQNFYKALTTIFDNPTETIKSGAYKGKPRWFRSLIKITPIRALYENTNSAEKRKYYDNLISMF